MTRDQPRSARDEAGNQALQSTWILAGAIAPDAIAQPVPWNMAIDLIAIELIDGTKSLNRKS